MTDIISEPSKVWMLWTKHGWWPRFVHISYDEARAQAEELARQHPGWKFHVLQAVEKIHVAPADGQPVDPPEHEQPSGADVESKRRLGVRTASGRKKFRGEPSPGLVAQND